jgi:hypothetical protein
MRPIAVGTKILVVSLVFALCSCHQKPKDPFAVYAHVTVPTKLAPRILSTDSIQWNNTYASQTQQLFYTKMGKANAMGMYIDFSDQNPKGKSIGLPEGQAYSDFYVNPEGQLLLFASNQLENELDTLGDWNIWQSKKLGNSWGKPELLLDQKLEGNQFYPWLTGSGNLYFSTTPDGSRDADIYRLPMQNGKYTSSQRLPWPINTTAMEADAFVSPLEDYMIFAGFDRKQNLGLSDLYICFRIEEQWTAPVWMGPELNSSGYDGSPFVTDNGRYLIFTSSRNSPEEKPFFNHYIVPFSADKFRKQALKKSQRYALVGKTPQRFEPEVISTPSVEYGGSFAPNDANFYFSTATADFSKRTIMKSQFTNGKFDATQAVEMGGRVYDASDVQINTEANALFFKMYGQVAYDSTRTDGNIFVSTKTDGQWGAPHMLGPEVNSGHNEYYPMTTQSGNLYFSRNLPGRGYDIYCAQKRGDTYLEAQPLSTTINTDLLESDAYVSPDESFMIFVRADAADGLGATDLYISLRENGAWTTPKNMEAYNSKGIDGSPFVDPNGGHLFFTSNRSSPSPETFDGHLDIYVAAFDINDWKN